MKNICVIFSNRKSLMTSIEDRDQLAEGQTEFHSAYSQDASVFNVQNVQCTQEVFDAVAPLAGTRQAAALIANPAAPQIVGRTNVYIQAGELKIVS